MFKIKRALAQLLLLNPGFGDWGQANSLRLVEAFPSPFDSGWDSPGARHTAAAQLAQRIRNSEVNLVVLAMRPHDMPMAPFKNSRLRRSCNSGNAGVCKTQSASRLREMAVVFDASRGRTLAVI